MGFSSQTGHVGFRTQSAKGSYNDPGAVAPNQGVFVKTRSGALGGDRTLMIPDPEIGGNRDIPDAQLGPIGYSGEYSLYYRMESLAFFLKAALGTAAVAGSAATGYTHTLTPADTLPWLSVEERISNQYEAYKYTDAKVNTMHLEAASDGYLMGSVGMIALTQALLGTVTLDSAARYDTSGLLTGTIITVTWNGVQLPAKSFSMDINNNIENDDFRLGSFFLGDAVEKRRELTMGVTIRPQDSALWRTAMWGAPAATTPGGTALKQQVVVTITSFEDIPGATGSVKYAAAFTIPKAAIKPFGLTVSGDDVMQHDLEIEALRPDPTVALITATVKNSYATLP